MTARRGPAAYLRLRVGSRHEVAFVPFPARAPMFVIGAAARWSPSRCRSRSRPGTWTCPSSRPRRGRTGWRWTPVPASAGPTCRPVHADRAGRGPARCRRRAGGPGAAARRAAGDGMTATASVRFGADGTATVQSYVRLTASTTSAAAPTTTPPDPDHPGRGGGHHDHQPRPGRGHRGGCAVRPPAGRGRRPGTRPSWKARRQGPRDGGRRRRSCRAGGVMAAQMEAGRPSWYLRPPLGSLPCARKR